MLDTQNQTQLLTVACRFIPHDQWLVTHVDSSWKIKQVKLWVLAKCISQNTASPQHSRPHSHPHNVPFHRAPTPITALDLPRHQRPRPASPITFAPDPRHRPISPITFAPPGFSRGRSDSEFDEDERPRSVVSIAMGKTAPKNEIGTDWDEDMELGYEEDEDTDGLEGLTQRHYRARTQFQNHPQGPGKSSISGVHVDKPHAPPYTNPNATYPQDPPTKPTPTSAQPPFQHAQYTLIRFSTGQILEDDFSLAWYDLRPYELLEVHRAGVVLRLPRQVISEYVVPYWEGWVRALRVVWRDGSRPKVKEGLYGYAYTYGSKTKGKDKGKGKGNNFGIDEERERERREKRRTKLEWRDRWVVIREGVLSLCKDREDTTPSQLLPLTDLTALRGAEHLTNVMTTITPGQRIVCAKFRVRKPVARFAPDPNPNVNPNANITDVDVDGDVDAGAAAATGVSGEIKGPMNTTTTTRIYVGTPANANGDANGKTGAGAGAKGKSKPKIKLKIKSASGSSSKTKNDGGNHASAHSSTRGQGVLAKANSNVKQGGPKGHFKGELKGASKLGGSKEGSRANLLAGVGVDLPIAVLPRPVWRTEGKGKAVAENGKGKGKERETVITGGDSDGSDGGYKPVGAFGGGGGDGEADEHTDSPLSSPVFARSSASGSGSDSWGESESDGWGFGMGKAGVRPGRKGEKRRGRGGYGLRYGYQYIGGKGWESGGETGTAEGGESGLGEGDGEGEGEGWTEIAGSQGGGVQRGGSGGGAAVAVALGDPEGGKGAGDAAADEGAERDRERNGGEWIVLDMGDDNAYTSILRILHRQFSNTVSSSFVAALPSLATPTSTPTPFPSPTSPNAPDYHPFSLSQQQEQGSHTDELDTTPRSSLEEEESFYVPPLPQTPRFLTHAHPLTLPQHPPSLASLSHTLSLSMNTKTSTLGALPYPEWRIDLVMRAQKAGMGEIGRAMEWMLWGASEQSEDYGGNAYPRGSTGFGVYSDEDVDAMKRRKKERRRTMVQEDIAMGITPDLALQPLSREKRRSAHSHASTITPTSASTTGPVVDRDADVRTSEETGSEAESGEVGAESGIGIGIGDSDSGEDSSEAEWQGWMADLHRQARVWQQQQELKRLQEEEGLYDESLLQPLTLGSVLGWQEPQYGYQYGAGYAFPQEVPQTQAQAQRLFQEGKRALEPSAVVTSMSSPPLTAFPSASHSLSSPSSSESLSFRQRARALSFGFSPVDPLSSSTSLAHSHSLSHSSSQPFSTSPLSGSASTPNEPPSSFSLYHAASMYDSPLRSEMSVQEPPPRRPSMPNMMPLSLGYPPGTLTMGPPRTSSILVLPAPGTSPTPTTTTFPASPLVPGGLSAAHGSMTSRTTLASRTQATSSTVSIVSTGSSTRRASSAGLIGAGSVGRTSSVILRGGGLLRKKEGEGKEKEKKEKAREKERAKEREKEERRARTEGKLKELLEVSTSHRPKLSVSTGAGSPAESNQSLVQSQPGTQPSSRAQSPTMSTARSILRRVRSGSSLRSAEEPSSPTVTENSNSGRRKKRLVRGVSVRAERLVRGLDSALDFVEGK